jgi:hypothetical protein
MLPIDVVVIASKVSNEKRRMDNETCETYGILIYCIDLRSFYGPSFYEDAWRCE